MVDSEREAEVSEPDLSDDDFGPGLNLETREEIERIQNENPTDPNAPAADGVETPAAADPPSRNKRKIGAVLTSDNWVHFTAGPLLADKKSYYAFCKYCPTKYLVGKSRSTSSMQNHWEKGCKKIPRDKRYQPDAMQMLLKSTQTEGGSRLAGWVFDQMVCRKSLARMVISHEYPFNCVHRHFLRVFLHDLQPSFKIPCRKTLRKDCIDIYHEEQTILYDLFGKLNCKVSFTSDLWSNKGRDRGFMAITAHFIDDNWKLRKRIVAFALLPSPHTEKQIAEGIYDRLVLWNLDKKILCLVLDNSTANDACIKELLNTSIIKDLPASGNIFHQRCGCHILNLIVQDGLHILKEEIKNIRNTMKYCRHSQARMEKFQLAVAQAKIPYKKPNWDVATRWNSTYIMLELALQLRSAFGRLAALDKRYLHNPSKLEWDAVHVLVEELKIFYDVTKKLSGTKYPTINLFFTEFCEVYLSIKKMGTSPYPFVVEMGQTMFEKWDKYWTAGKALLAIALVLDPRCKLVVVEFYYKKLDPIGTAGFLASIKTCMDALFKEYEGMHGASSSQVGTSAGAMASASTSDRSDTRAALKDYIRGLKNSEPQKSELEDYLSSALEDASLDEEFDILAWWKLKAPRYPILSRLSRDILVVPISTVASESAFSTSGRTLSPVRSCLNDESIEALLCAQDWLRASVNESGGTFGDPLWTIDEDYDTAIE